MPLYAGVFSCAHCLCRWAKKGGPDKSGHKGPQAAQELQAWDAEPARATSWQARTDLKPQTIQSLQTVDESIINYDLIEALIAQIVDTEQHDGPQAFWQARAGPGHDDQKVSQDQQNF